MQNTDIKKLVENLVERVQDGRPIHEVIDDTIDRSPLSVHSEILESIGDCDLSEPLPDLKAGWEKVRAQLAFNALYRAVTAALKS